MGAVRLIGVFLSLPVVRSILLDLSLQAVRTCPKSTKETTFGGVLAIET